MKILLIYPNGNALNNHSGAGVRAYSIIENLINEYFPYFVIFIIRIWLKNRFQNKSKWIQLPEYILDSN